MPRVKYLKKEHSNKVQNLPNFSITGSVRGMRDKFYGKDALLVRCGSYIYNCSSKPEVYHNLAY